MAMKLFILDGHYHVHRACHAPIRTTLTSPSGELTNGVYIFTTALLKLIREQMPDMLVVAMEGRGKTIRSELYSDYKATRSRPSDDFIAQRDKIEEILDAMNIPVIRVDGYEADDIIGTIAKRAANDGYEVCICSNDKDMLQLVDHTIYIFDVKTNDTVDLQDMIEKTGVTPDKFVEYLALQGDSADNIPGISGVGSKTAANWISKYGSIRNLISHADELKDRYKDSLLEFNDQLYLNIVLMTIMCDVPIDTDYEKFALKEFDRDKLRKIFIELGFNQLLTRLGLDEEENILGD